MPQENLWAGVNPAEITVPNVVLKHFTDLFNATFADKMGMTVESSVSYASDDDSFDMLMTAISQEKLCQVQKVILYVPSLGSYRQSVLKLFYPINAIYPCTVEDYTGEELVKYTYEDADALDEGLRKILSSKPFIKTLSNLLAQI